MSAPLPPAGPPNAPENGPSGWPNRPADDDAGRALSRAMLWQAFLLLLTVVGLSLVLPFKLVAVSAGAGAAVVGFVGLRKARAVKGRAFTRFMLVGGSVLGLLGGALAFAPVIFWEQSVTYERCLQTALTERAVVRCETEFQDSVNEIGRVFGG